MIEIDLNQARQNFYYDGRKFELRINTEIDHEIIIRYEVFMNGRELDLSVLLDGDDGDELFEYLSLPYNNNGNELRANKFPKDKLLYFIEKIARKYIESPRKSGLFLKNN